MCSSYTEVGYLDWDAINEHIAYEQELKDKGRAGYPEHYRENPEMYDYAIKDEGRKEWRTGATFRSKSINYVDSETAWREAIEAGKILCQQDLSQRVFAREVYWCSGTEIQRTAEVTPMGPINEWRSGL